MLSKLLSLLVAGKGGALAAAAIVASATTVSVMTTSAEVQDGMNNVVSAVQNVVGLSQSVDADTDEDEDQDEDSDKKVKDRDCLHDGKGQPVVVAQRNAADKLLRIAYKEQQQRLEHPRGGKDDDHGAANAVIQKADRQLREILTKALNDVARETLGREGQIKPSGTPTATPTFTLSPTATPTFIAPADGSPAGIPKPTCTPKPSPTPTPTGSPTATPTATPTASPSAGAAVRGREEVALRVTLDPKLQAIVDKAKADMKAVADKALADLAALPTRSPKPTDHGKPAGTAAPNNEKKDEDRGRSGDHKPSFPVPSFSPRGGRP